MIIYGYLLLGKSLDNGIKEGGEEGSDTFLAHFHKPSCAWRRLGVEEGD